MPRPAGGREKGSLYRPVAVVRRFEHSRHERLTLTRLSTWPYGRRTSPRTRSTTHVTASAKLPSPPKKRVEPSASEEGRPPRERRAARPPLRRWERPLHGRSSRRTGHWERQRHGPDNYRGQTTTRRPPGDSRTQQSPSVRPRSDRYGETRDTSEVPGTNGAPSPSGPWHLARSALLRLY